MLYTTLVEQARLPEFYRGGQVPDTVDGRFDLITLHAFLLFHRLAVDDAEFAGLRQTLFDLMFADLDQALREMGVGDLGVGKKIKVIISAFYGRMAAYEEALTSGGGTFPEVLRRNLYRGREVLPEVPITLAGYLVAEARRLEDVPRERLLAGDLRFGPPPWGLG